MDDVGDELEGSTRLVITVLREERDRSEDELFTERSITEADFVDIVFVFKDSEVVGKTLYLV